MPLNFRAGLWRLADPKISITSAASMAVGAGLAVGHPEFSWRWLVALGIAMFCMEVAKNAWGEIYDYDSGTDLRVKAADRTEFSGGKRVLVDGLLSRQQTGTIAVGFTLIGLMLGALMVFLREPALFWIGLAGLLIGWSYHGPPLQLAYRGLGEIAVVICYGPLIAMATYMLMTGAFATQVIWLSLPLGVLIAAFLWVNQFPDYEADQASNKRNLVVVLGKLRAAAFLPIMYALALFALIVLPLLSDLPRLIWLGLLALPPASFASYWTINDPHAFHRHKPVQAMALLTFVAYSLGTSIGVALG
ncbi:prenyltransferase [Wenzhouxiangella limi]|uniref:Prenyltransferase n=1 Tax=Wenzhouxiangella limi TaxID=2707351 RepID=A0A845UWL0_9GAMM|nr:prenyltransferase [Wenzhouxiangella limi]NDY94210.1 prenyltransferase [Wenzhouxiangella limi]